MDYPGYGMSKIPMDLVAANSQLQHVNTNDWVLILDRGKNLNFQKGEMLIRQGKQPEMVFVVVHGRAKIRNGLGVTIARIGPGEICGEMAFLENTHASASVIAEEAMVVYGVAWPALQELFELYPHLASRFYRSLAVSLSAASGSDIADTRDVTTTEFGYSCQKKRVRQLRMFGGHDFGRREAICFTGGGGEEDRRIMNNMHGSGWNCNWSGGASES